MEKPTIFVSCGQGSPEEVELGREICGLVKRLTPFEPYFAENQNSVDGLTINIFKAMNAARGFVAVMHRRGLVFKGTDSGKLEGQAPALRGSVWVEQEIAVAAFLRQALGHDLLTAAYIEKGIEREGVRGFIILNPKPFSNSAEVLKDLERVFADWAKAPLGNATALELLVDVIPAGYLPGGGGPQHALRVSITNRGTRTIRDWKVEVDIPKGVREPGVAYSRLARSDAFADIFRVTHENPPRPPTVLQSGDTHDAFRFEYALVNLEKAVGRTARVRVWVDDELVDGRSVELT